jgi:hypothetical protein
MDPLTLAAISGGAQVLGGTAGAIGQYAAMQKQLKAQRQAQGAITNAYGQAQTYQQPYLQAGQTGLERMMQGNYDTALPGQTPLYQPDQFNYEADPGMAYRMQTGQQAIETSQAGKGQGLSGATLKALAKFGQNLGSQEYQNAYGRYSDQRRMGLGEFQANDQWGRAKDTYTMGNQQATQRYGRASDLGTMGQSAAGNMSNMATGYGENIANLYGAGGQARAAGTAGMGQTIGTTLGNIGNTALDAYTMGQLNRTPKQTAQSAYNQTPYGRAANQAGLR